MSAEDLVPSPRAFSYEERLLLSRGEFLLVPRVRLWSYELHQARRLKLLGTGMFHEMLQEKHVRVVGLFRNELRAQCREIRIQSVAVEPFLRFLLRLCQTALMGQHSIAGWEELLLQKLGSFSC